MRQFTRRLCVSASLGAALASSAAADLVITEIMYDPNSDDGFWEWIEIYNNGGSAVSLAGYVFDDDDGPAQGAANIAGGSIPAGGTGVLYNSATSAANFALAWGSGINLIPVTNWPGLNTPDAIGLWSSFAVYDGRNFLTAFEQFAYGNASPWPTNNNAASIYLTSLSADNTQGVNWARSVDGIDDAYDSDFAGGNTGNDIGSPGIVPEPGTLTLLAAGGVLLARRPRRVTGERREM